MVAMNSIPQQEVANGRGQIEFLRARPTTLSKLVAKKPSPPCPLGASATKTCVFMSASIGIILNRTGRAIIFYLSHLKSNLHISTSIIPQFVYGWILNVILIFPLQSAFLNEVNEATKKEANEH